MADYTLNDTIQQFFDDVNSHDAQKFLDYFPDDGIVDDWGRSFEGKDAIEKWSNKEFIGSDGTLNIESATENGNEVVVVGDWQSNYANGKSEFTFTLQDGKIKKMQIREG